MIGSISAKITADDTEFLAAMGRVKGSLKTQAGALRSSANQYAKWGAAAAAAAAVAGAAIIKSSASSIQELRNLSNISGTSAQDLQKLSYAASTVGISQEKLAGILKDVNDRIGDFTKDNAGEMKDFFDKIAPQVGVTAKNFKDLSSADSLQLYVSTLEKANLSQAEMTTYMEKIADESTALLPILKNGGAAYAAMAKEAEDLGLVLSDLDIAKATAAAEQMGKLEFIMNNAAQQATVELAPAIIGISKAITKAAKESGGFGKVIFNAMDTAISVIGVFKDGIRGIEVIIEGLKVGFWGIAHVVNLSFQKASEGVDYFVNTTKNSINTVLEGLNALGAGIPLLATGSSQATKYLEKQAAASKAALDTAMGQFHDLAMQELPSEGLKKWLATVREESDKAAAAVAAAMAGQQGGGTEGGGSGMNADEQKKLEAKVEAIRVANLTEMELLKEKFAMEAEILAAYYQNKKDKEEEFKQQMIGITSKYADEETKILADAKAKQQAVENAATNLKMKGAKQMFGNLSSLMNTESRKLFEIGKTAAIANAVINAYEGISNTLKDYPYPLNIGMAAAHGAAAFAQVQSIKSQSFSRGAGSGQVFSGGAPATPTTDAGGSGQPTSRNVNISLTGSSFGAGGIRDLIEEINGAVGDGVNLNVG